MGFEGKNQESFLALSLREKSKVRCKILICMDPWEMGAKEFLESSFFEKVKEEIKVQPIRTKKEENKEVKQE